MGLAVTAVEKLGERMDVRPEDDMVVYVDNHKSFKDRADGIEPGLYRIEGEYDVFDMGSYSGYNRFREILSQAVLSVDPEDVWVRPGDFEQRPLFELINFSDCEGFIGPSTSSKLHQELVEHRDTFVSAAYDEHPLHRFLAEHEVERYDDLTRCFELAANTGGVAFH